MKGYVYILYSPSLQKTYTGSTDDVDKRFKEHNRAKSIFTSKGIPWFIWHTIEYPSLEEARKMENILKQVPAEENFVKY